MTETEQKQEIRKNKSFNAAQTETGSPLKTLKGSDISRHLYRDYLKRARRNPRLASAQVTRPLTEPALPADNTAAAVAEYVQRKYGTDAAVEYIAEEVAARRLYSDEAETILRRLRTGA